MAALVVSKVYFFLGNHHDALQFALGAGNLFDVGLEGQAGQAPGPSEREYVETVIGKSNSLKRAECSGWGEMRAGLDS